MLLWINLLDSDCENLKSPKQNRFLATLDFCVLLTYFTTAMNGCTYGFAAHLSLIASCFWFPFRREVCYTNTASHTTNVVFSNKFKIVYIHATLTTMLPLNCNSICSQYAQANHHHCPYYYCHCQQACFESRSPIEYMKAVFQLQTANRT